MRRGEGETLAPPQWVGLPEAGPSRLQTPSERMAKLRDRLMAHEPSVCHERAADRFAVPAETADMLRADQARHRQGQAQGSDQSLCPPLYGRNDTTPHDFLTQSEPHRSLQPAPTHPPTIACPQSQGNPPPPGRDPRRTASRVSTGNPGRIRGNVSTGGQTRRGSSSDVGR